MKILHFSDEQAWFDARIGKITGSKLAGLIVKRGTEEKIGFYETIAERVATRPDSENRMARGRRLESEALERFETETGKKVNKDLVICFRDDDKNIAYSPDGLIGKTEDVEVKCLNSAAHIEALLTKEIPNEYEAQIIQGFVVNDDLKTRYMVFYDPRMPKDFFYLTIHRADLQEKITEFLDMEREVLRQIALIESQLTF